MENKDFITKHYLLHTDKETQMEGISDRETNYQRETLTREILRHYL